MNLIIQIKLTSFFVLIKHNVAYVFNIKEVLFFKALYYVRYYFLFNPNKYKPIFHHACWNFKIFSKLINRNSLFFFLKIFPIFEYI